MMKTLVRRAVASLVRWAVVEDDGADRGPEPWQQIRAGEQSGISLAVFPYGFHAVAPPRSRALRWLLGGEGGNRAHLPLSGKQRPRIASGEVVVFHPETGSKVWFRADGSIDVDATGDLRAVAAGDVSVEAGGDLAAQATGAVSIEAGTTLAATAAVSATITAPTVTVAGHLAQTGDNVGLRGATPVPLPVVTGGAGNVPALENLLAALDLQGIIDDQHG